MGGREMTILRASQERNEPVPKEIENRPTLWPICAPYWRAFWELNGSRPIVSTGMGTALGHLNYVDKAAYAKDHGLAETTDDLDDFLALVGAMDTEYVKLKAPKSAAPSRRSRSQQ